MSSKPLSIRTAAYSALVIAGLVGCQQPPSMQDQVSGLVRNLSVVPVFPFREDVQVGDVYEDPAGISDLDPDSSNSDGKDDPIGLWLYHLDVNDALTDSYGSRPSFTAAASPTSRPVTVLMKGDSQTKITRLRTVAFPSFASMQVDSMSFNAFMPVETAATITAAAGSAKDSQCSLSIPEAESYGLPAYRFLDIMQRDWDPAGTGKSDKLKKLYDMFERRRSSPSGAAQSDEAGHKREPIYLRVLTEVYYAQSINLNISASQGSSFGLDAELNQGILGLPASTVKGAPNAPAAYVPANGASGTTLAQALQTSLNNSGGSTAPGVKFTITSASDTSITLNATFDQPVAVGIRGFVVKVHPDGKYETAGTINSDKSLIYHLPPKAVEKLKDAGIGN